MNEKITVFLDEVCNHIKYKKIHQEVRTELTEHILENAEKIGVEKAILQMGNSSEIGERLHKQHRPKTEWSLIALVTIIALIGGIVMFASSKFETGIAVDFGKYIVFVVIGILVMGGLYFFDYTKLKKLSLPIYIGTMILLILTLFIGMEVKGRKFLVIGNFEITCEYCTILFLISFVGFMEKYRGKSGFAIVKLIALGVVSVLPVIALPNLSVALVMLICYAVLIVTAVMRNHFSGNKKAQLLSLGSFGAVGFGCLLLFIVQTPYRLERITSFLSRGRNDPMGSGFLQVMVDNWLSVSNWFGKTTVDGWGLDRSIPNATTDYVLINVIGTFGWAVGIALIIVVSLFIIRMFMTIKKVKNDYGFYLSLSACVILSVQFVISILLNFNLFPLMSMSMPFVSYGGTGYIVSMALIGIILSVWRRNNLVRKTQKPQANGGGDFIKFEDGKLIINFR